MSIISKKIDLVEKLALSGNFTPVAIKILLDIVLSFDELSYEDYIEILKGAHVVIRNDSSGYWGKWKVWAEEKEGTCIDKSTKDIVEGVDTGKGCLNRSGTEWVSYKSDRWSSHPSVSSINLRGKKEGSIYGGIAGKSIDQYEINMGHNRYGSTFSMLCGTYEWRSIDTKEPTTSHTNYMLDPKESKKLQEQELKAGTQNDITNRDYLVTWFQFEQYAANTHHQSKGLITKSLDIFSHCLDWASYKWTKKNIGPFGRSNYTENPWKPLYIHCCPDVCYRRSVSKGKHSKKKIQDVNYSSGKICQESLDQLIERFELDKLTYINKETILDKIMEKYCYSDAIPCNKGDILYKGRLLQTCGSTSVESILDKVEKDIQEKNFDDLDHLQELKHLGGGKKRNIKRKYKTKSIKNKKKINKNKKSKKNKKLKKKTIRR